jgi:hypothetical protein
VAKVLAAMAAGAWVVSTDFLDAARTARTLVEPVTPPLQISERTDLSDMKRDEILM